MERKQKTLFIRQHSRGRITIPAEFRKRLGLTQDSLLQLTLAGDKLRLRPLSLAQPVKRSTWLKDLYEAFAPVRQEAAQYSDSEINATIEEAVDAVRAKRRL